MIRSITVLAACLLLTLGCAATDLTRVDPPAGPGSMAPNLAVGADRTAYLSWVEPDGDGHALRFARYADGRWSTARTIARGLDWFVNWADLPSLAVLEDGTLAAHWLVRSGSERYAYDVHVAVSPDGGASWTDPVIPHPGGGVAEHGFVSMVPDVDSFVLIWLDGRRMEDEAAAMTLRWARLDRSGTVQPDREIDDRVCDCCCTDATRLEDGSIVAVYRDRTQTEVRDIAVSRFEAGDWQSPQPVHEDGWSIRACPVNGPAVATDGGRTVVAWFTAASGDRRVMTAFSVDGGRRFGNPVRIDDGDPIGRVDVVLAAGEAAEVTWIGRREGQGRVLARRVQSAGELGPVRDVATTVADRAGGFPRSARTADGTLVAWTEPGSPSRVRAALLR